MRILSERIPRLPPPEARFFRLEEAQLRVGGLLPGLCLGEFLEAVRLRPLWARPRPAKLLHEDIAPLIEADPLGFQPVALVQPRGGDAPGPANDPLPGHLDGTGPEGPHRMTHDSSVAAVGHDGGDIPVGGHLPGGDLLDDLVDALVITALITERHGTPCLPVKTHAGRHVLGCPRKTLPGRSCVNREKKPAASLRGQVNSFQGGSRPEAFLFRLLGLEHGLRQGVIVVLRGVKSRPEVLEEQAQRPGGHPVLAQEQLLGIPQGPEPPELVVLLQQHDQAHMDEARDHQGPQKGPEQPQQVGFVRHLEQVERQRLVFDLLGRMPLPELGHGGLRLLQHARGQDDLGQQGGHVLEARDGRDADHGTESLLEQVPEDALRHLQVPVDLVALGPQVGQVLRVHERVGGLLPHEAPHLPEELRILQVHQAASHHPPHEVLEGHHEEVDGVEEVGLNRAALQPVFRNGLGKGKRGAPGPHVSWVEPPVLEPGHGLNEDRGRQMSQARSRRGGERSAVSNILYTRAPGNLGRLGQPRPSTLEVTVREVP
ncbi:hypothetical protein STIAU_7268 [Stigmatella aurantiaca DW4/3-1]|uniref:Uncharacterized protein n=1 Tax=Stigmatella aurantiaca (strain DW4/3-1) TaxID=378806 RepID=Q090F7_STIAD|nr:hypothetical protein STIAU_7268 [Stigmatella aurantiaca DW4/3-1]